MTDLHSYVERATRGATPEVDWSKAPWAAAQAALHWLGFAPPAEMGVHEPLSAADAEWLSGRMLRTFIDDEHGLVWSSGSLDSAIRAIADSVNGPPEPFLRSTWRLLYDVALDARCYEFCREIGRVTLANYRASPGWDLAWMTVHGSPSQVCLRYWTMGVKPGLWTQELERESMETLKGYPFQF